MTDNVTDVERVAQAIYAAIWRHPTIEADAYASGLTVEELNDIASAAIAAMGTNPNPVR